MEGDGDGRGCDLSYRLAHAGTSSRHGVNCLRDILKAAAQAGLMQAGLMQGISKPYITQAPGAKGRVIDTTLHYLVQNDGGTVDNWCLTQGQFQSDVGPCRSPLQV